MSLFLEAKFRNICPDLYDYAIKLGMNKLSEDELHFITSLCTFDSWNGVEEGVYGLLDAITNSEVRDFLIKLYEDPIKYYLHTLYISNLAQVFASSKYRIEYHIDNVFANVLQDSITEEINMMDLFHLPVPCFYINTKNIDFFKTNGIIGFLVNIQYINQNKDDLLDKNLYHISLTVTWFREDTVIQTPKNFMLFYKDCEVNNGRYIWKFNQDKIWTDKDNLAFNNENVYDENNEKLNDIRSDDFKDVLTYSYKFILNFLLYINSQKPDIKESKYTLKAKNRAERLNKPYNEATEYEVGYRLGKSITIYNEKVQREYEEHKHLDGERKSPKPHLVRAHWHGYYFGEGRKRYEYIWVPPYFKGYGEIDCVIHECVETNKSKYTKPELMLYTLLELKGISYRKQEYIPRTGRYYDACAIIDGHEIYIEYDGPGHFRQVAKQDYPSNVKADTEKNAYCKEHNIPLLRIRYEQDLYMSDILDTLIDNPEQYLERRNPYLTDAEYYAIRKAV